MEITAIIDRIKKNFRYYKLVRDSKRTQIDGKESKLPKNFDIHVIAPREDHEKGKETMLRVISHRFLNESPEGKQRFINEIKKDLNEEDRDLLLQALLDAENEVKEKQQPLHLRRV